MLSVSDDGSLSYGLITGGPWILGGVYSCALDYCYICVGLCVASFGGFVHGYYYYSVLSVIRWSFLGGGAGFFLLSSYYS